MESYLNITIRVAKAQAEAAIASLKGQLGSLNGAMSGGGIDTASSVRNVDRLTGSLRSAGYALTATFTAPLLAAGKGLLDFELKNQTAMADLNKVYGTDALGNYSKDMVALRENFKALSNEFGVNQTEVIQIGAAWAQAGVQGAALAQSVRNTLNTMVIGDLSSAAATTALISIQGQYGASSADLTKILQDLNVVENITAISMGGLVDGFQRAAGAAANGGVTYRELGAMLASLTPYAGTASQAGNSLKTIISNLEAPSSNASKAIKALGIDIADSGWKSATATDKLKEVARNFMGLSDAQKNVEARALSGAFQVSRFDILLRDIGLSLNKATEGQSRYGKAMDATASQTYNAAVAQHELEIALNSNPKKLQILGDVMKNSLADVLVKLLPLILNIVSAVTSMVTWFGNLNPNIQKLVGIFLLVMAALGPVLLYLSALRDVVRFAGGAFEFLLSPLKLVPAALGLILAPGRAAIGLIGLIGGLFSSSGKESQVGAVRVGASMDEMTAAIAANVATMTGLLAELLTLMGEGIPAAAATAAAAVGGSFADIVGETTVGMTATAEAVNLGMAAILTETETGLVLWNEEFATAQMRNTVIIQEGFLAQVRVAGEGMAAIEGEVAIGAARTEGGLLAVFTRIPSLIIGIFAGIGPALVGAGEAIVGVLTGPIGIAIAAVVIGFALFRKQIVDGWNAVVGWFKNGAGGLAGAFQPIVNIFDAVVNAAIGAFNSLPLGIRNALQAVVDLVASAVHAVYELFSYLNPWAHHSPSLVENVTTGMDAVQAQFKRLLDVSGPINSAYADIKKFGAEVAALVKSADSIKIRTEVADIKKAGGGTGAVTAYLTETADVARLTAKQTELSAAMKKQQEVLDGLDVGLKKYNADIATQNTLLSQLQQVQAAAQEGMNQASADLQKYQSYGITGQKAMSDAIFQSQMAEKALQLQMMQIEDVTGPMANVQSRMQALQGSMDALRGTSKALRNAGASADITGVYDAQTAAMQTQFDTTRAQVLQYDALQKQLTDVQHKTQELQLQDSLTYDPLTRQINDAASAMKELPFDQILQGVTDSKNALILYTQQYNDATKAVKEQQEVIKGITTARDALQARYDTENAKLDQLKKSYQDVAQAISDVNAELTKLTSSSQAVNSATSAAKGAKGGGATSNFDKNFAAAAGGNFPSAIGKGDLSGGKVGDIAGINAATETSIKNLQDRLKGLNPFKAIQDKWKEFQSWWGTNVTPNLKQFWDNIFGGGGQGAGAGGSMFDGLKSGASALLNFVRPLWTAMKQLWDLFKPDFVKLWKDLKDAFMQIGNDIGPKLVPLFKALMDNFRAWWPIIKIVAEVIGVLLIGAFKVFADILVNVLGPILHGTIALIGDAITIITGVLQVITGVINFTVDLFTGKWGKLRGDMMEILKGVWNIFKGTFEAIYHFLEAIWKTILGNIKGFVNGIVDFFRWLYDILVGHSIIPDMIRAIVKWFTSLPGWVLNAIKGLGSLLWSWAVDAFNWVIRGFTHMWDILTGLLGGLGGKILSALGNVKDLLYNVGSDIVHGLKQGLDDAWHFVTDRFHDLVNLIPGPIKHLLGIASPSRVMAETIGAPIAQGVGVGILEQTPYVMDKMKNLANSVKNYKFIAPVLPAITSLPTAASFAGRATTPAATMTAPASAPVAPTIVSHTDDHSTTVHVESLVLPNIKTPADAQELLDNLEALANGSR